MSKTWLPLSRGLVDSSIWLEDLPTRVIWIYLLVEADYADGVVDMPIAVIARNNGIPLSAVNTVIDRLASPDPYSRSAEYDGRRIEFVDGGNRNGGIRILNYQKYQDSSREATSDARATVRATRYDARYLAEHGERRKHRAGSAGNANYAGATAGATEGYGGLQRATPATEEKKQEKEKEKEGNSPLPPYPDSGQPDRIRLANEQLLAIRAERGIAQSKPRSGDVGELLTGILASMPEEPPETALPCHADPPVARDVAPPMPRATESQLEPIAEFDISDLADCISAERKLHKLTPYVAKLSDYQTRQDAVDEIIAIAESEHITPREVAVRSLRNFYGSKEAWLNNNGYPLGSYAKQVGHWYRPPKRIEKDIERIRSVPGVDETEEYFRKQESAEKEAALPPAEIGEMIAEFKKGKASRL